MFGRGQNKGTANECNRLYGENMDLKRQVKATEICRDSNKQTTKLCIDSHVAMLQDELGKVMMYCPQRMQWIIDRRDVMMSRRLVKFFEPFA